ncbi:MAG: hypothetical protein AAGJ94_17830 [Pseudomonadota bacterium]
MSGGLAQELTDARSQNARLIALVDRLFKAAEEDGALSARLADHKRQQGSPEDMLDQALSLLDEAVSEAERQREATAALDAMLERALTRLESLEADHRTALEQLGEREAALEEVLALSERSLEVAASARNSHAESGFWRRLFGRGPTVANPGGSRP